MKIKNKVLEIIFLVILSFPPLIWLRDNSVIIGHDSGSRLQSFTYLGNLFYSWNPLLNFGVDWTLFKGFIIAQLPEILFSQITGSFSTGQAIAFCGWFFLMGISMYIFINAFYPEKRFWIFRIMGSILYMYNFFLLQGWVIVERAKFSLFAALPFGLLIIYNTIHKKYSLTKGTILFSLVFFLLNGGGAPTLYGAVIMLYFVAFVYLTILNVLTQGYKELLYSGKTVLLFICGAICINAYWLLPQFWLMLSSYSNVLAGIGGIDGILGWEASISKNASFLNIFRLQGVPDWYDNALHPYAYVYLTNTFFILFSFLFILLVLLGLMLHQAREKTEEKKERLFILIFIAFIIGMIFTAGSHPPLGFFYVFLLKYIPGFSIFRSSFYKFGPTIWFSYAFLIAYSLNLLISYIKNRVVYACVSVIAILIILLYHFPFFTGSFFEWNKPFSTHVKVPSYVYSMSSYVNNNVPLPSHILLLPFVDGADSYTWGYWSTDTLPSIAMNRAIVGSKNDFSPTINNIYKAISENDEKSFLYYANIYGIDKVLWRSDVLFSDKITTSKDLAYLNQNLSHFKSVSKEKQIGAWTLYTIHAISSQYAYISKDIVFTNLAPTDSIETIYAHSSSTLISAINDKEAITPLIAQSNTITQAQCIHCDYLYKESSLAQDLIAPVQLLPDSILYMFIRMQEKKILTKNIHNPQLLFQSYVVFSNTRLAEILGMVSRIGHDNLTRFIQDDITQYKNHIALALDQIARFSDEEKNVYYASLFGTLEDQKRYISAPFLTDHMDINQQRQLHAIIDSYMNELSNKGWITTAANNLKYQFTITSDGFYTLNFYHTTKTPRKIILDKNTITSTQNIFLRKGSHNLSLAYSPEDNLLIDNNHTGSFTINAYNHINFSIKNFDSKTPYLIKFTYRLTSGKVPSLMMTQAAIDNNKKPTKVFDRVLNVDYVGVWDDFSYLVNPIDRLGNIDMSLYLDGTKDDISKFDIKDISIAQATIPVVVIRKVVEVQNIKIPIISVIKINSTHYRISVKNASSRYVLILQEAYSPKWEAKIVAQDLAENNHVLVNGIMNGWLIDKKGDYTVDLNYSPQKIVTLGVIISISTICIFVILTFLRLKKYEI